MQGHDIIVVGASAGGVQVLSELIRNLPPELPAAIFVVLHIPRQGTSILPKILNRSVQKHQGASLLAAYPQDGDAIQHGRIYVAPPDHQLTDLLFESVAGSFKQRAIAVVFTGKGSDGAMGLRAIKEMGGTVIVQAKGSSEYFGMPGAVIDTEFVNWVVPLNEIADTMVNLVTIKNEESQREQGAGFAVSAQPNGSRE